MADQQQKDDVLRPYEGHTAASMAGHEYVFCIAIQHADDGILRAAKAALANHPKFATVCAAPRFVEGATCSGEPLVMAGKISGGEILGDAWNSRPAREAVRRERGG